MTEHVGSAPVVRPRWLVPAVILGTCAAAVGTTAIAWTGYGPPRDAVAMIVLSVLSIASWLVRVTLVARVSVAAGSIISLASIVLVGPVGSALVNALAMGLELGTRPWRVRVFNAAMAATCGAVGGLVYLFVGGTTDTQALRGPAQIIGQVGLPLIVADIVQTVTNVAMVAAIVWADKGTPYRRFVRSTLFTSGSAQVGYGIVGFLFVILWGPAEVGPFSAALILLPLSVARWAFVQYGEEQRAHERTIAALVAAAETRDPHALGHSERVADLADAIGDHLGIGGSEATALRYAAMLHDIGMVGPPVEGQTLGDRALLHSVLGHPDRGATLVADIAFLAAAVPAIRHHHERFDGRGYPGGLAGPAIPLASRIIAVADAFDALTRAAYGRCPLTTGEAVAALRERGGTHLDPGVCDALAQVLQRPVWRERLAARAAEPVEAGPDGPATFDHDDPRNGDEVVGAWRGSR